MPPKSSSNPDPVSALREQVLLKEKKKLTEKEKEKEQAMKTSASELKEKSKKTSSSSSSSSSSKKQKEPEPEPEEEDEDEDEEKYFENSQESDAGEVDLENTDHEEEEEDEEENEDPTLGGFIVDDEEVEEEEEENPYEDSEEYLEEEEEEEEGSDVEVEEDEVVDMEEEEEEKAMSLVKKEKEKLKKASDKSVFDTSSLRKELQKIEQEDPKKKTSHKMAAPLTKKVAEEVSSRVAASYIPKKAVAKKSGHTVSNDDLVEIAKKACKHVPHLVPACPSLVNFMICKLSIEKKKFDAEWSLVEEQLRKKGYTETKIASIKEKCIPEHISHFVDTDGRDEKKIEAECKKILQKQLLPIFQSRVDEGENGCYEYAFGLGGKITLVDVEKKQKIDETFLLRKVREFLPQSNIFSKYDFKAEEVRHFEDALVHALWHDRTVTHRELEFCPAPSSSEMSKWIQKLKISPEALKKGRMTPPEDDEEEDPEELEIKKVVSSEKHKKEEKKSSSSSSSETVKPKKVKSSEKKEKEQEKEEAKPKKKEKKEKIPMNLSASFVADSDNE